MSAVSKAVLGVTVLLSVGAVAGVHIQQSLLREKLREGVVRDIERQIRKEENLRLLKEQIVLTKQLEIERDTALMAKGPQQ
ncbi:protein PET117 homolog, mitochondrial [Heteronotia binoei]|uniref:protein PET117 homolog, mitochondrial n=1 Tax=Heteronotia binoei TaxID=13085 RepID=UPI0029314DA4|nr:protein PET117 homolog, mitochondrial [Heteronotia binoei]